MRSTFALGLLALLPLVSAKSATSVIALGTDTFNSTVSTGLKLVKFYAPWCGHCKTLAPEYEQAAERLKARNIDLIKVDCTESEELCTQHGVQGYPTLKLFRDGVASDYTGGRKEDLIVAYMEKQAVPHLSEIPASGFDAFCKQEKVVIVGLLNDPTSAEYKTLDEVAKKHRDSYLFGFTKDAKTFMKHTNDKPGLIMFKTFDEGKSVYEGGLTNADEIIRFIKTESVPIMDEVGPENFMSYVESGLPLAFFFYSTPLERTKHGVEMEKLAKEYKGQISFVYTDAAKFGGHAEVLGLKANWPAFAINELTDDLKWPLSQETPFDVESVRKLCQGFVDKTINATPKSEPLPEAHKEGTVRILVGKNYQKVVMDEKKDVLVEFYAPWCGHCKKLAPTWDKLAAALASEPNIVIAKMDSTANDLPFEKDKDKRLKIAGFPTLKLFKAHTKEVIDFDGGRTFEDLIEFLRNNAHHKDFEVSKVDTDNDSSKVTESTHDEL